ncbi:MAG: hypothetical protein EXS67_00520 [Candidatus Margulisbacteria bacterium]|nr:hypothetical protein [Candidatus Margulisiibacteriota bacterium]
MSVIKLMQTAWKMIRQDPIVVAPALIFFLCLNVVESQLLKGFAFDKPISPFQIWVLCGVLVFNLFCVILNTSMGLSVLDSGQVNLRSTLWHSLRAFFLLMLAMVFILVPILGVAAGALWLGSLLVTIPSLISVITIVGQGLVLLLILILMMVLQFFPILALDIEIIWFRIPIEAVRFTWTHRRSVLVFTASVYFVKLMGLLLSLSFASIPVVGEAFFLAFFRSLSQCIAIMMTILFYMGIRQSIEKASVTTSV